MMKTGKKWMPAAALSLAMLGSVMPVLGASRIQTSSGWQYVDASGSVVRSKMFEDGSNTYAVDENGQMITGWYKHDGKQYYMDRTGAMKKGWLHSGSSWYAFSPKTGEMQTGWYKDGSKWYWLNDSDGSMKTGWLTNDHKSYYLDQSGAMKTGWLKQGESWYYLKGDGVMARDEWLDIQEKGSTVKYLFDQNGVMCGKAEDSGHPMPEKTWKEALTETVYALSVGNENRIYSLVYIDDNDIPELFSIPYGRPGGALLHVWHEGKIYTHSLKSSDLVYGEKKNKIVDSTRGGMGGNDAYYKLEQGELTGLGTRSFSFTQVPEQDEQGRKIYDQYFWNEKPCSHEEFYDNAKNLEPNPKCPIQTLSKEEVLKRLK